jgi:hypothetical protein
MAKALFHKGERVFVKPVGAWATVERIMPHWVKGVEEPLRVHYDVGLGREFQSHELVSEQRNDPRLTLVETENWRVLRARNRWHLETDGARHPHPGTFPVVVTDALDWGGWRVPAAEYERDPDRIEQQARVIVNALRLMRIATELTAEVEMLGDGAPKSLKALAEQAELVLGLIYRPTEAMLAVDTLVAE